MDVKLFIAERHQHMVPPLYRDLPGAVADLMTCDECAEHADEIDLVVTVCKRDPAMFEDHGDQRIFIKSTAAALLEVSGYPHRTRLDNLPDRMKAIATKVKQILGLPDDQKVSHTFHEVQFGHWDEV